MLQDLELKCMELEALSWSIRLGHGEVGLVVDVVVRSCMEFPWIGYGLTKGTGATVNPCGKPKGTCIL